MAKNNRVERPNVGQPVEEPKVETVPAELKVEPPKEYVVANCASVHIRTQPSKTGDVRFVLNQGTEVDLVKVVDKTWSKISCSQGFGFVMSAYIRER